MTCSSSARAPFGLSRRRRASSSSTPSSSSTCARMETYSPTAIEQAPARPTAFLSAGQGSQSVGMGKALASSCPHCPALFERADEILRFPLRHAMWEGSADDLRLTAVLQPALLALEVAQARHLRAV